VFEFLLAVTRIRCNHNRIAGFGFSATSDTTFFHFVKELTDFSEQKSEESARTGVFF